MEIKNSFKFMALPYIAATGEERQSLKTRLWEWIRMKVHLRVEVSNKDVEQIEKILAANNMSMNKFVSYAIAGIVECRSGNNVKIYCS